MKEYLTKEEYKEIKKLTDYALNAANKKEAENYTRKIQSYGYDLSGRANNILNELVCYVKDASGRVPDKERRVGFVKNKLYELEFNGVK